MPAKRSRRPRCPVFGGRHRSCSLSWSGLTARRGAFRTHCERRSLLSKGPSSESRTATASNSFSTPRHADSLRSVDRTRWCQVSTCGAHRVSSLVSSTTERWCVRGAQDRHTLAVTRSSGRAPQYPYGDKHQQCCRSRPWQASGQQTAIAQAPHGSRRVALGFGLGRSRLSSGFASLPPAPECALAPSHAAQFGRYGPPPRRRSGRPGGGLCRLSLARWQSRTPGRAPAEPSAAPGWMTPPWRTRGGDPAAPIAAPCPLTSRR